MPLSSASAGRPVAVGGGAGLERGRSRASCRRSPRLRGDRRQLRRERRAQGPRRRDLTGLPALADDSGIVVHGLDGQPGIHSARWAGPERDFDLAIGKVLNGLTARYGSFAAGEERAEFVAVLCLVGPKGERFFEGRVAGTLVDPPRGAAGFGYDPIFVPEGLARTFAEMTAAEKHAISHRRRALDAFLAAIAAR